MIVVLSPLLQRFYIERFWTHGRGTVIRLEGGISTDPGARGAWVWTPAIEYHADGRRLTSRVSDWQRFNAKPKYSVGDRVNVLYDPLCSVVQPSRPLLWPPILGNP